MVEVRIVVIFEGRYWLRGSMRVLCDGNISDIGLVVVTQVWIYVKIYWAAPFKLEHIL